MRDFETVVYHDGEMISGIELQVPQVGDGKPPDFDFFLPTVA